MYIPILAEVGDFYLISVFHSPRILQQFINPPNMTNAIIFITYMAPVLRVLVSFQFIHIQSKISLFNEVKLPVSWEDITGPAHIAVSHVSHISKQQFELLLVQDIPF